MVLERSGRRVRGSWLASADDVTLEPDGGRLVLVESIAKEGGCLSCGLMSSRVKERAIAGDYGVAWWTVHRILVANAVKALGAGSPTTMIGIDETRARSVRWFRQETGWARSDPWMTSIVDLDTTHPGGIIGRAPRRSGACVQAWMSLQAKEFREGCKVVAIDPSAPYASGIRRVPPQARIVLDHFHLMLLANTMLTDIRQRAQDEQQGRRGMKVDRPGLTAGCCCVPVRPGPGGRWRG